MKRQPEKLIELCRGKKVFIQTHNFPDPDAIGSSFGLQQLLKCFDIDSILCHEGQIDKLSAKKMLDKCGIEMYAYDEIRDRMTTESMIILIDCQKGNGNTTDFIGSELAAIDHHPTFIEVSYQYADLCITGSCCTIIAEYYKLLDLVPSQNVAAALLYGLRMDTLDLSRGVTAFDVKMYDYLFGYADRSLLEELERNNMEFADLQAYGTAINHIQVYGKVGFSYIDYNCPDAMIGILSDFLMSLQEVEVVIIYAHRVGGYKFSVRSECGELHAGHFIDECLRDYGNGGGHASMAGGFAEKEKIEAKGEDVFHTVQDLFIRALKERCPHLLG